MQVSGCRNAFTTLHVTKTNDRFLCCGDITTRPAEETSNRSRRTRHGPRFLECSILQPPIHIVQDKDLDALRVPAAKRAQPVDTRARCARTHRVALARDDVSSLQPASGDHPMERRTRKLAHLVLALSDPAPETTRGEKIDDAPGKKEFRGTGADCQLTRRGQQLHLRNER